MIPVIRRARGAERVGGVRWIMCAKSFVALTNSFGSAFRFWLWELGVPDKICFYYRDKSVKVK